MKMSSRHIIKTLTSRYMKMSPRHIIKIQMTIFQDTIFKIHATCRQDTSSRHKWPYFKTLSSRYILFSSRYIFKTPSKHQVSWNQEDVSWKHWHVSWRREVSWTCLLMVNICILKQVSWKYYLMCLEHVSWCKYLESVTWCKCLENFFKIHHQDTSSRYIMSIFKIHMFCILMEVPGDSQVSWGCILKIMFLENMSMYREHIRVYEMFAL